jgi:hypothetical protein
MDSLKKHGDPLEEEIRQDPARGIEEVASNQPGSKGRREEEDQEIVRSANQTPNPNPPVDDATMEPGGDLGNKRTNM